MENFVTSLWSGFTKAYSGLEDWAGGLFSFTGRRLSIESIANHIDPRFVPQAPMSGEGIDVETKLQMSHHGFKFAKLITAQSHPELFEHWTFLCKRAGFTQPLQLILCESDIPNAFAVSESEMGLSTGLLQRLTYREVSAVLSHELGHANNYQKQQSQHVAATGGMSLLGFALPWTGKADLLEHSWQQTRNRAMAGAAASFVGQIAGSKISGYSTELEADLESAVISRDPEALISALTKLDGEIGKMSAWKQVVGKLFAVHPSTPDRVHWLQEVKKELDVMAPTAPQPATTLPAHQISAGQTSVERVSTIGTEPAISGA